MELLIPIWIVYALWLGTRTEEQQQNHLALLWVLMTLPLIGLMISWVWKFLAS